MSFDPKNVIPAQIRAARALLGWSQTELEDKSRVAKKTIADFERGARQPFERTLIDLCAALTEAGVEFTNSGEPGVRLRAPLDDEAPR